MITCLFHQAEHQIKISMTKNEILRGNKLIATYLASKIDNTYYLFEELKSDYKTGWYQVERMQFHCSWDWLMLVVDKIATRYDVNITWSPRSINVTYINRPDVEDGEISSMGGMTPLENTWHSVVRFIEWDNEKGPHEESR